MVKKLNKNEEVQCGICYTCQTCVTCEKYGEVRGQATTQAPPQEQRMPVIRPPPQQMPMQIPQPMPTQLLTVEDIRRIVKEAMLEVLLQLGLVKPQEKKRELK
jgi:hypothetical protein